MEILKYSPWSCCKDLMKYKVLSTTNNSCYYYHYYCYPNSWISLLNLVKILLCLFALSVVEDNIYSRRD